ncbi:ankyrin-2-like [Watersipora subatra]|uniref:ankyrin-2-like n=1 Tax=Watersipora subatra TaxID=2589382 RepID=UPI00355B3F07
MARSREGSPSAGDYLARVLKSYVEVSGKTHLTVTQLDGYLRKVDREEVFVILMSLFNKRVRFLHVALKRNDTDLATCLMSHTLADHLAEVLKSCDEEGETILHLASILGYTRLIKQSLDTISKENRDNLLMIRNSLGKTALHCASRYGHTDIVKGILDSLSSENKDKLLLHLTKTNWTALHYASTNGHTDIVKCILDSISSENKDRLLLQQTDINWSALHSASRYGHTDIVKYILDSISSDSMDMLLLQQDDSNWTALHCSSTNGHTHIVKCILNSISSESKDELLLQLTEANWSALHYASRYGHTDIVKCILDSISSENKDKLLLQLTDANWSALHRASRHGHTDTVKCILGYVSSESKDRLLLQQAGSNWTALHSASRYGHTDIVKCVLDSISPESKDRMLLQQDDTKWTALHSASTNGHTDIVKCILDSISSENKDKLLLHLTETNWTALHRASRYGHTDIVKCILDSISSNNMDRLLLQITKTNWSALHSASKYGHTEIVKCILGSISSENSDRLIFQQTDTNRTALHYASRNGHTDIVKCILDSISSESKDKLLLQQNNTNMTALHYASSKGHTDIVKCVLDSVSLESKDRMLLQQNDENCTALHCASIHGHTDILKFILDSISPEIKDALKMMLDNKGNTAMQYAAREEYSETSTNSLNATAMAPNDNLAFSVTHKAYTPASEPLSSVLQIQPIPLPGTPNGRSAFTPVKASRASQPTFENSTFSPTTFDFHRGSPHSATNDALLTLLQEPANDYQSSFQIPSSLQTHNLEENLDNPFVSHASLETAYSEFLFSNSKTPDLSMVSSESPLSLGQNLPPSLRSLILDENEPSQVSSTYTGSPYVPNTLMHSSTSTSNSNLFTNPSERKRPWSTNYSITNNMSQVEPAYAEATSTVTVEERENPIDLSHGPTPAQVFKYEGQIVGEVIKLIYNSKRLVFPFSLDSTVGEFTNTVQRETGSICKLHTTDGYECTNGMLLKVLPLPFIISIGNSQTTITSRPATSSARTPVVEDEQEKKPAKFGRVSTTAQVIQLFTFVHERVIEGKTINAALKLTGKDRQTIERFKNIYYLHLTNATKLNELKEESESFARPKPLRWLNEKAGESVDWDFLKEMAVNDKATLFGAIKK